MRESGLVTTTWWTRPSSAELRELSTPELGLIMLRGWVEKPEQMNPNNALRAHEQAHARNDEPDTPHLLGRLSDAWAWLVANGLIGPTTTGNPADGWHRVTDRGRQIAAEATPASLYADERLPHDLHERLGEAKRVFRGGNPELGVFEAMRQVEIEIRDRSGSGQDLIGVKLARTALHPENGSLTDMRLEAGERQALMDLFVGALGTFKNSTSHRIVDFGDPARAADAIILADLLLRTLDDLPASQ